MFELNEDQLAKMQIEGEQAAFYQHSSLDDLLNGGSSGTGQGSTIPGENGYDKLLDYLVSHHMDEVTAKGAIKALDSSLVGHANDFQKTMLGNIKDYQSLLVRDTGVLQDMQKELDKAKNVTHNQHDIDYYTAQVADAQKKIDGDKQLFVTNTNQNLIHTKEAFDQDIQQAFCTGISKIPFTADLRDLVFGLDGHSETPNPGSGSSPMDLDKTPYEKILAQGDIKPNGSELNTLSNKILSEGSSFDPAKSSIYIQRASGSTQIEQHESSFGHKWPKNNENTGWKPFLIDADSIKDPSSAYVRVDQKNTAEETGNSSDVNKESYVDILNSQLHRKPDPADITDKNNTAPGYESVSFKDLEDKGASDGKSSGTWTDTTVQPNKKYYVVFIPPGSDRMTVTKDGDKLTSVYPDLEDPNSPDYTKRALSVEMYNCNNPDVAAKYDHMWTDNSQVDRFGIPGAIKKAGENFPAAWYGMSNPNNPQSQKELVGDFQKQIIPLINSLPADQQKLWSHYMQSGAYGMNKGQGPLGFLAPKFLLDSLAKDPSQKVFPDTYADAFWDLLNKQISASKPIYMDAGPYGTMAGVPFTDSNGVKFIKFHQVDKSGNDISNGKSVYIKEEKGNAFALMSGGLKTPGFDGVLQDLQNKLDEAKKTHNQSDIDYYTAQIAAVKKQQGRGWDTTEPAGVNPSTIIANGVGSADAFSNLVRDFSTLYTSGIDFTDPSKGPFSPDKSVSKTYFLDARRNGDLFQMNSKIPPNLYFQAWTAVAEQTGINMPGYFYDFSDMLGFDGTVDVYPDKVQPNGVNYGEDGPMELYVGDTGFSPDPTPTPPTPVDPSKYKSLESMLYTILNDSTIDAADKATLEKDLQSKVTNDEDGFEKVLQGILTGTGSLKADIEQKLQDLKGKSPLTQDDITKAINSVLHDSNSDIHQLAQSLLSAIGFTGSLSSLNSGFLDNAVSKVFLPESMGGFAPSVINGLNKGSDFSTITGIRQDLSELLNLKPSAPPTPVDPSKYKSLEAMLYAIINDSTIDAKTKATLEKDLQNKVTNDEDGFEKVLQGILTGTGSLKADVEQKLQALQGKSPLTQDDITKAINSVLYDSNSDIHQLAQSLLSAIGFTGTLNSQNSGFLDQAISKVFLPESMGGFSSSVINGLNKGADFSTITDIRKDLSDLLSLKPSSTPTPPAPSSDKGPYQYVLENLIYFMIKHSNLTSAQQKTLLTQLDAKVQDPNFENQLEGIFISPAFDGTRKNADNGGNAQSLYDLMSGTDKALDLMPSMIKALFGPMGISGSTLGLSDDALSEDLATGLKVAFEPEAAGGVGKDALEKVLAGPSGNTVDNTDALSVLETILDDFSDVYGKTQASKEQSALQNTATSA